MVHCHRPMMRRQQTVLSCRGQPLFDMQQVTHPYLCVRHAARVRCRAQPRAFTAEIGRAALMQRCVLAIADTCAAPGSWPSSCVSLCRPGGIAW